MGVWEELSTRSHLNKSIVEGGEGERERAFFIDDG